MIPKKKEELGEVDYEMEKRGDEISLKDKRRKRWLMKRGEKKDEEIMGYKERGEKKVDGVKLFYEDGRRER